MVVGGAALAQKFSGCLDPKSLWSRAFEKLAANVGAVVAGGLVGGLACAVAIGAAPAAMVPLILAGGVAAGGLGVGRLAHAWRTRDVAEMVIGDSIPVAPYAQAEPRHEAINQLTETLHRSIGQTKARLTGLPYDETAPKIVVAQHFNDPHPIGSPLGD
jgi:hypothetical protein